jgi:hypothetical protein
MTREGLTLATNRIVRTCVSTVLIAIFTCMLAVSTRRSACVRRDGCSQARVCGARAPRSHLVTHTHPHTYDVAETEEIFSREEEFTAHMTVMTL